MRMCFFMEAHEFTVCVAWLEIGGQWAVGGGQWAVGSKESPLLVTDHWSLITGH